jgi:hypothetical protein
VGGATVRQIVAIDRGDDRIGKAHARHGLGEMARLFGVGRRRPAMGHVAKRTAARAEITEDHEGRGAV